MFSGSVVTLEHSRRARSRYAGAESCRGFGIPESGNRAIRGQIAALDSGSPLSNWRSARKGRALPQPSPQKRLAKLGSLPHYARAAVVVIDATTVGFDT